MSIHLEENRNFVAIFSVLVGAKHMLRSESAEQHFSKALLLLAGYVLAFAGIEWAFANVKHFDFAGFSMGPVKMVVSHYLHMAIRILRERSAWCRSIAERAELEGNHFVRMTGLMLSGLMTVLVGVVYGVQVGWEVVSRR